MAEEGNAGTVGWLLQVIERKGRLLRVTQDRAGAGPGLLAFTFDVGTVRVGMSGGSLTAEARPVGEGEAAINVDEDDPWWTVLGNPLTKAQEHEGGILLQFREEADSPKIVWLVPGDGALSVRVVA